MGKVLGRGRRLWENLKRETKPKQAKQARSRHRKEQKCDWKGKQRKDGLNAEGRMDLSLEALEGVSAVTGPGPLQAPMDCKAEATRQRRDRGHHRVNLRGGGNLGLGW